MMPNLRPRSDQSSSTLMEAVANSMQSLRIARPVPPPRICTTGDPPLKFKIPPKASPKVDAPTILVERIIRVAPPHFALPAASALKRYLLSPMDPRSNRDKLQRVLHLLRCSNYDGPGTQSRTAVLVAATLSQKLLETHGDLANEFRQRVVMHARGSLQEVITVISNAQALRASQEELESYLPWMHRGAAFFADCYAFGFIDSDMFCQLLDAILEVVDVAALNVFSMIVIPFLARGLTRSARKLPVAQIDKVMQKWAGFNFKFEFMYSLDKDLKCVDYIQGALESFRADALKGGEICDLPFHDVVGGDDEAQAQLCEFFIWETLTPEEREKRKDLHGYFEGMTL